MSDTTALEGGDLKKSSAQEGRGVAVRRSARAVFYIYAVVLPVVVSAQAVCLALLWRPPDEWVSFFARFATSPAIAGLSALLAALIGARSLRNQLSHTKEKAADESWWQQFEWVTDRLITSARSNTLLPSSLAFDLVNSLSRSARAPFQKDAVIGILNHYLNEFVDRDSHSSDDERISVSDGPGMDAAGANSLRNLINVLPETSRSSAPARRVLEGYEYQQEVLKALRHQGFDELKPSSSTGVRPDGLFATGSTQFIVEIKPSINIDNKINLIRNQVKQIMSGEGVAHGLIITPQTMTAASLSTKALAAEGIYLLEWEPPMGSHELKRLIREVLR